MRIVLRTLGRSPAFTVTSIATIALAVALAATAFAIVDGVLFKALPYERPGELYFLAGASSKSRWASAALAPRDLDYLRKSGADVRLTAFSAGRVTRDAARPEAAIRSATIADDFFDVLGVQPLIGGFGPEAFVSRAPGEPEPAIVSYSFWRDRLGADPNAVGRIVELVEMRVLVAGVLRADFVFPIMIGRARPDILLPLVVAEEARRDPWSRTLSAVARLPAAPATAVAESQLDAALAAHANEYPPRKIQPGPYVAVTLTPVAELLGSGERRVFRLAFGAAALILLLGCVNVAGLTVARGHDRGRELSIRAALGATGGRVLGLMLRETTVLAVAGAALGVAASVPVLSLTRTVLPETLQLLEEPTIDWRVTAFAVVSTMAIMIAATTMSFGRISRRATLPPSAAAATATPRAWGHRVILAAESALGITLIVAGWLMVGSWIALRAEEVGFDTRGLAVLDLLTPEAAGDEEAARRAHAAERLRAHPGVSAIAALGGAFLENAGSGSSFALPAGAVSGTFTNDIPIAGDFFAVARLRLRDGRALTAEEIDGGSGLAVVGESVAERYWPSQRAVGQQLTGRLGTVTVVGVVEEAQIGSQADTWGEIYVPARWAKRTAPTLLVRTAGDPDTVVREAARAIARDVDGVLIRRAESIDTAVAKTVRLQTFRGLLFGVGAAAAMLLLAVGVAGLVAMNVARRMKELGIRTALGAQRAALGRLIVFDHLRPVAAGAAAGLAACWWITRLLTSFLHGLDAHEPSIWILAVATLFVTTAVAAWLPASRAARVDPIGVLRTD